MRSIDRNSGSFGLKNNLKKYSIDTMLKKSYFRGGANADGPMTKISQSQAIYSLNANEDDQ